MIDTMMKNILTTPMVGRWPLLLLLPLWSAWHSNFFACTQIHQSKWCYHKKYFFYFEH